MGNGVVRVRSGISCDCQEDPITAPRSIQSHTLHPGDAGVSTGAAVEPEMRLAAPVEFYDEVGTGGAARGPVQREGAGQDGSGAS